ncbi:uncharacterized protein KGF55_005532 [Candida pseudojiufengensis]|uniref:uncharacterized protein n=1 Tax=Candida pseudojiufengensis TaxID=497109 RepID=UPI00222442BA|nr:uncharacterized protein KGF55_005532 [Candida pseudojiufengensis]KAI5959189.1 hypothetical protein KGF55_005532 [Candida pseudojiufengensis]
MDNEKDMEKQTYADFSLKLPSNGESSFEDDAAVDIAIVDGVDDDDDDYFDGDDDDYDGEEEDDDNEDDDNEISDNDNYDKDNDNDDNDSNGNNNDGNDDDDDDDLFTRSKGKDRVKTRDLSIIIC